MPIQPIDHYPGALPCSPSLTPVTVHLVAQPLPVAGTAIPEGMSGRLSSGHTEAEHRGREGWVLVRRDGRDVEIPVEGIVGGDTFIVKPGRK